MPASAARHRIWCFAGHTDVVPPGDEARWPHPPFAGEIAGGVLYGRGAVDMKGGIACALAAALDHLAAHGGKPRRLALLPHHRRRGRRRGQRHRQAAAMGGRARRALRPLHPGRAEQRRPRSATPSRSAGAARSTARSWSPAGRAMSPIRSVADNPIRGLTALMTALMTQPLDDGSAHFEPSQSRVHLGRRAAIRSSTSFPARRARASTSASTTATARLAARSLVERARARPPAASAHWRIDWEPSNADVFLTRARPVRRSRGRRHRRGHRPQPEALDHRRHLGRALHQGLLPGARIRPGGTHHAPGRRMHAGRRPRARSPRSIGGSSRSISGKRSRRSPRQRDQGLSAPPPRHRLRPTARA